MGAKDIENSTLYVIEVRRDGDGELWVPTSLSARVRLHAVELLASCKGDAQYRIGVYDRKETLSLATLNAEEPQCQTC